MSKKILVLYYSQTGQLDEIVTRFTTPFTEAGVVAEKVRIKPLADFEFPWTSPRFFDAMPESVLAKPVELAPFEIKEQRYDLVVFAYQPWFLSPSIPANSILQNPRVKSVLRVTGSNAYCSPQYVAECTGKSENYLERCRRKPCWQYRPG